MGGWCVAPLNVRVVAGGPRKRSGAPFKRSLSGSFFAFVHHFYIVAPTLSYKFELFSVVHGISFYPLTLRHGGNNISMTKNDNFATFRENLKTIFASQSTVNVVHSILAQLRS